ncbi:MAG: hypothetical protein IPJ07_20555 [Acidobacteria bacterium]|nr:hypothetical protein [Acidobacteriota bacterium]
MARDRRGSADATDISAETWSSVAAAWQAVAAAAGSGAGQWRWSVAAARVTTRRNRGNWGNS